jgi:hypothetical protein
MDFIGKNDYFADFDNEIVFQFSNQSEIALEMRLDQMIKQDEKKYQYHNKERMNYYCNWSKDRSTRSAIMRKLSEISEGANLKSEK